MQTFETMANKIRHSGFGVLIFIVSGICTAIALGAAWEDYLSSYHGYMLLPTRKATPWIGYLIGALPWAGQITLFYAFIQSGDEKTGEPNAAFLWATLSLLVIDLSTDVYYKAYGGDVGIWLIALFESFFLFTMGSEVLLTIAGGIFLELLPDAMRRASSLAKTITNVAIGTTSPEDLSRKSEVTFASKPGNRNNQSKKGQHYGGPGGL
ncbi:MAG: hypothetical protein OEX12_06150 [Gammaproteobacteria bacterium]|nr:hypothetical protein [Gammaproteobacteria bacterium]